MFPNTCMLIFILSPNYHTPKPPINLMTANNYFSSNCAFYCFPGRLNLSALLTAHETFCWIPEWAHTASSVCGAVFGVMIVGTCILLSNKIRTRPYEIWRQYYSTFYLTQFLGNINN